MSGPTGISCNSRTEDLIDRWAQDAGIVGKGGHVHAHHALGNQQAAWKGRNPADAHEFGHAASHVAPEVATQVLEHAAEHSAAAGACAAFAIPMLTVVGAYQLYKGWAEAHAKGDDLANRAHNDAVNCAMAVGLQFDERFGKSELAKRPGVTAGTEKLLTTLKGKDVAMVPILQGRADEGFNAMERAFAATQRVPLEQRAVAMDKWLADNGFGDKMKHDIAFQKGAEYFVWTKSTTGVDAGAEAAKVHARLPPDNAFSCRG